MSRVGARRHLILQPLELVAERLGEEVGHDADELADLDEQALQLDDGALDAAGVAPVRGQGEALDGLRAAKAAGDGEPEVRSATCAVTTYTVNSRATVAVLRCPATWGRAPAHRSSGRDSAVVREQPRRAEDIAAPPRTR